MRLYGQAPGTVSGNVVQDISLPDIAGLQGVWGINGCGGVGRCSSSLGSTSGGQGGGNIVLGTDGTVVHPNKTMGKDASR
ncbi:MAG: hypothetical protein ACK4GU_16440 [Alishewanella aestuarii]